jgi:hypothetical protein
MHKYQGKSNLDELTLEQRDKVYTNVANAVSWLYKTVKERKEREFLEEIRNLKANQ